MFKHVLSLAALIVLIMSGMAAAQDATAENCGNCHKASSPALYMQWEDSKHAENDVTCVDCHGAVQTDPDAFMHEGSYIAVLVTPKDCGGCHEKEAAEVQNSYHATAGKILESKDAYLAHVAGGEPAAVGGCISCHGAKMEIDPDSPNKLAKKVWPNSGIGRINPDGSLGACNACHTRHTFSKAQARRPEACGKCHLGPDHPQIEIYTESKHGNTYYTNIDKMNLDSDSWVVGEDYSVAPTCATCHMAATPTMGSTHDVGQRISWTLRPPVSNKKDNWEEKRQNMKTVCVTCHSPTFADGHYYQFDALVNLYNEKFAKPAGEIVRIAKENKLLENPAAFSNKLEWIYWEIWHHEGRRARHGAAMMGPDYTWWHGIYEVAQHFYFKLIPEARKYNDPVMNAYLDDLLTNNPMHSWMSKETSVLKDEIRSGEMQKVYEKLFEME